MSAVRHCSFSWERKTVKGIFEASGQQAGLSGLHAPGVSPVKTVANLFEV